jgi:hypothetical protein
MLFFCNICRVIVVVHKYVINSFKGQTKMAIISGGAQIGGGVVIQSWNQYLGYGNLWTWGQNSSGQLGNGSTLVATSGQSSPGTVAGNSTTWLQVSCGYSHTAAIKTDGTLWTWGYNSSGRLGDGTINRRSSPGTVAGGGTTWASVGCGYGHTAAIKTDGTLWTWGRDGYGQLGDGTITDRSSPGTTAGGGLTWRQVSAGYGHTAAIKTDGTLWTSGYNSNGQLGNGTVTGTSSFATVAGGGTTWAQVSCANAHTAAIKTDGTLWTWGYNQNGQLGTGTTGDNTSRSSPGTTAGGGTTWQSVAAGSNLIAAIKTDGTLWTWGRNNYGQLGTNDTTDRSSPGTVAGGGTTWKQVASGGNASGPIAAIKTDGTLWTCGYNLSGQLGNGTTTGVSSFITVTGGGTTWGQVSCSQSYMAAIAN